MKKNNKLRINILKSVTLFTFAGVALTTLASIGSFNNEPNKSLDSSLTNVRNISPRATPSVSDVENAGTLFPLTYPFQILNDVKGGPNGTDNNLTNFQKYFTITDLVPGDEVTFQFQTVNNETGNVRIIVSGKYIDNATSIRPWSQTVTNGTPLKKVNAKTTIRQRPSFVVGNIYASDVKLSLEGAGGDATLVTEVMEIVNGNEGSAAGPLPTNWRPTLLTFDNRAGILHIDYELINFFTPAEFIQEWVPQTRVSVEGFIAVPGDTKLGVKEGLDISKITPSSIAESINKVNYTDYFQIMNGLSANPGPATQVDDIEVLSFDDASGKITVKVSFVGAYFDVTDYVKKTANSAAPYVVTQTFEGFLNKEDPLDLMPIIIGSTVGSFALIGIIALTIVLVMKANKSKAEKARKEKLANKTGTTAPPKVGSPMMATGKPPAAGAPATGPKPPGPRPTPPSIKK
ncbi:MAG: hypothetical protein ACRCVI_02420 [Mycoplasmoidaceae bacterium]